MPALRRLAQLTMAQRLILVRGLLVLGVARVALACLPMEAARRVVSRAASGAAGDSVEQVVWAVRVVSRCLPGVTCLSQALAAQALLKNSGFPSQIEIGVAKGKDKDEDESWRFRAHAWVVCHGQVVLGGGQVERYNSLMVWD